MKQLIIDTCNKALSVALVDDVTLVASQNMNGFKNHAETLFPVIDSLVSQAKWQPTDLEQIIVAYGPGSYTGVRIGVTSAKTLGYTLKIPVKCISSLELLAYNLCIEEDSYVVSLINARRNHVYASIYQVQEKRLQTIQADTYQEITDLQKQMEQLDGKFYLVGDYQDFIWTGFDYYGADHYQCLPQAYYGLYCQGPIYTGADIHQIEPNYLKQVEAIEKWEEQQTTIQKQDYIKTTKS